MEMSQLGFESGEANEWRRAVTASRTSIRFRTVVVTGAVVVLLAGVASAPAGAAPGEPEPGVCSRTPQVRDRILQELDMTDCNAVTRAQVGRIGALWINDADISELRAGDFEGLGGP